MTNFQRYQPTKEALLAQSEKIIHQVLSRSKQLNKLFHYLIEKEISLIEASKLEAPQANVYTPKEIEIAIDVYGKGAQFNPADDSTVRVNILNLRKKLESYYIREGKNEAFQIYIPTGSYRLAFKENEQAITSPHEITPTTPNNQEKNTVASDHEKTKATPLQQKHTKHTKFTNVKILLVIFFAISLIVNIAGGVYFLTKENNTSKPVTNQSTANNNSANSEHHPIWQHLRSWRKPPFIVMGNVTDYAKVNAQPNSQQLELITRGTGIALTNILKLFTHKNKKLRVSSNFNAYDFRVNDTIYVGPLNSLGMLDQYLKGSNFSFNSDKTKLTLKQTKQVFEAPKNLDSSYIDYGIFAKFKGPSNNYIYIITGFSDTSIMRLSWYLTDMNWVGLPEFSNFLTKYHLQAEDEFEILFKTPSTKGVDLGHEFIFGGKINSRKIWQIEQ